MPMSQLIMESVMRFAPAFAFAMLVSFGFGDALAQQSNAPTQPPSGQQPGQMQPGPGMDQQMMQRHAPGQQQPGQMQMGPGMDHQMMQRQPSGQQQPGPGPRGSGMGQERMPQRMEHQGMGQGPAGRAREGAQQYQPQGNAPAGPPKQN